VAFSEKIAKFDALPRPTGAEGYELPGQKRIDARPSAL